MLIENELVPGLMFEEPYITRIQACLRRYLANKSLATPHSVDTTLHYIQETECSTSNSSVIEKIQYITVRDSKQPNNTIYTGRLCKCCFQFNGYGTLFYQDGSSYQGMWKEGMANGQGTMKFSNGDVYEGCWKNDKAHGLGKYYHNGDLTFFGEWANDFQNGFGIEKWPDGSSYEGYFKNGRKEGKGKFTWADNSSYEGEFMGNLIDGYGEYVWPDGRKYIGKLKGNLIEGSGFYEYIPIAQRNATLLQQRLTLCKT
jgi:hypothetical protein